MGHDVYGRSSSPTARSDLATKSITSSDHENPTHVHPGRRQKYVRQEDEEPSHIVLPPISFVSSSSPPCCSRRRPRRKPRMRPKHRPEPQRVRVGCLSRSADRGRDRRCDSITRNMKATLIFAAAILLSPLTGQTAETPLGDAVAVWHFGDEKDGGNATAHRARNRAAWRGAGGEARGVAGGGGDGKVSQFNGGHLEIGGPAFDRRGRCSPWCCDFAILMVSGMCRCSAVTAATARRASNWRGGRRDAAPARPKLRRRPGVHAGRMDVRLAGRTSGHRRLARRRPVLGAKGLNLTRRA